jgi:hypothetical protein
MAKNNYLDRLTKLRMQYENTPISTDEEIEALKQAKQNEALGLLVNNLNASANAVGQIGGKQAATIGGAEKFGQLQGQNAELDLMQKEKLKQDLLNKYKLGTEGIKNEMDVESFQAKQEFIPLEKQQKQLNLQQDQMAFDTAKQQQNLSKSLNRDLEMNRRNELLDAKKLAAAKGDAIQLGAINDELQKLANRDSLYRAMEVAPEDKKAIFKNMLEKDNNYTLEKQNLLKKSGIEVGKPSQLDLMSVKSDVKPPTEGEKNNALFANRMEDSNKILNDLYTKGYDATSWYKAPDVTPNVFKSEDRQLEEQAKRDFVNAVLRKESGAVISQQEFDNADKQYFPQRGDSAEVLAQKSRNRENAIAGVKAAAGNQALGNVQKQLNNSKDRDAYEWALQNKDDPRSKKILERLGM